MRLLRRAVADDRERSPSARRPALRAELHPRHEVEQAVVLALDRRREREIVSAEAERSGIGGEELTELLVDDALVEDIVEVWTCVDDSG